MSHLDDVERRLTAFAAYYVGLFTGAVRQDGASPAEVAHALFLLEVETARLRQQWIKAHEIEPQGTAGPR